MCMQVMKVMTVRKTKKEVVMNRSNQMDHMTVRVRITERVLLKNRIQWFCLCVCLFSGSDGATKRDENECAQTSAGKRLKNESSSDDSPVKPAAKKTKKNIDINSDDDFE